MDHPGTTARSISRSSGRIGSLFTARSRNAAPSAARLAPVFAALGDETRLFIVARLCTDGPLSIVRLTEGTKLSRQAVTKHLRSLSKAGLVRGKRTGRERIWNLETQHFADVQRYLAHISEQWDGALERLRAFVE